MKVVLYEMKKIWNIKMLLIIAILCTLFYFMFMGFYIKYFPNGHPETEEINLSIKMIKQYGLTLEPEECSEFIAKYRAEVVSEAEKFIKKTPVFSELGIYSYEDFKKVREKNNHSKLETDAFWMLYGKECNFVGFKLEAIDRVEENYYYYPKYTLENLISEATNKKEIARLTEIKETEEYRNIMSGGVFENTMTYSIYLAVLVMLVVLVLVSPLIITDHARNVHLLQYTSKYGRKILNQQLIAIMLSAFLLTTVLLLVFGAVYSMNGTWLFWNNGLLSFFNIVNVFLFNMTYGQYVIAYIALLYVLCLGTSSIAFILSRFSQNLITLMLKLIPVFGIMWALCYGIFLVTFSSTNIFFARTGIIGIEPVVCGSLLIIGLAMSLYIVRKEKKTDII